LLGADYTESTSSTVGWSGSHKKHFYCFVARVLKTVHRAVAYECFEQIPLNMIRSSLALDIFVPISVLNVHPARTDLLGLQACSPASKEMYLLKEKTKFRGPSPQTNYTD
jgi:hypothetical protein